MAIGQHRHAFASDHRPSVHIQAWSGWRSSTTGTARSADHNMAIRTGSTLQLDSFLLIYGKPGFRLQGRT